MEYQTQPTSINQSIFNMDLPVETVSLYLLCCSLYDAGTTVSTVHLMEVWNSTQEAFDKGIENLEKRNIIREVVSDRQDRVIYRLTDAEDWVD